jgi:hypothetical protein
MAAYTSSGSFEPESIIHDTKNGSMGEKIHEIHTNCEIRIPALYPREW